MARLGTRKRPRNLLQAVCQAPVRDCVSHWQRMHKLGVCAQVCAQVCATTANPSHFPYENDCTNYCTNYRPNCTNSRTHTVPYKGIGAVVRAEMMQLVQRYVDGDSFRTIAKSIGRSEYWLRVQIHQVLGSEKYRSMVVRTLLKRITHAHDKKRWKHSIWALRRHKPEVYEAQLERERPKSCRDCRAKLIQAEMRAGRWRWKCDYCGSGGFIESKFLSLPRKLSSKRKETNQ